MTDSEDVVADIVSDLRAQLSEQSHLVRDLGTKLAAHRETMEKQARRVIDLTHMLTLLTDEQHPFSEKGYHMIASHLIERAREILK